MRERLLARSDWAQLAARLAAGPLGPGLAQLSQARAASLLRGFRLMCELEPDAAPPGPQACMICLTLLVHHVFVVTVITAAINTRRSNLWIPRACTQCLVLGVQPSFY